MGGVVEVDASAGGGPKRVTRSVVADELTEEAASVGELEQAHARQGTKASTNWCCSSVSIARTL